MSRLTLEPLSSSYPDWARILSEPPRLRVLGSLEEGPRVAIVGTRKPTPEAESFAFGLGRDLAEAGVVVWSGGAVGIDAAAHKGAVSMNRSTVAVIGSGLDRPYPDENADLFEKIVAAGGALVSPFEDSDLSMRSRFFRRNEVLAAAVSVLVIVECSFRSGALNAAKSARGLGKRVAVVPHSPWEISGRGCLDEIRRGAAVVTSVEDILRLAGFQVPSASVKQARAEQRELPFLSMDPREAKVLELLATPRSAADLCETLEESPGSVATLLLDLTLRGAIEEVAGGLVVRRSHPT